MRIVLLNGSAKTGVNNTGYFFMELEKFIGTEHAVIPVRAGAPVLAEEDLEKISGCDALVVAFSLFVNGIPAHLLSVLEKLEGVLKGRAGKITVYGMSNNGFYEGLHNKIALDMLRHWCTRSGLVWGGALGIGSGEMYGVLRALPLGIGPKGNLKRVLKNLAARITRGETMENYFFEPNCPRFFYLLMANLNSIKRGKKNNLRKKDMLVKPA
jgi:hypothetical protein